MRHPRPLIALAAGASTMVMVLVAAAPASAHQVDGNLPGGTSISVAIDSPSDGAVVPPGSVTVTGTASVGEGPAQANTAIVYVLDVSGSTAAPVPNCGAGPSGDILDCEILAAQTLNSEAIAAQTIGAVGAVVFATGAVAADVDPGSADVLITGPDTDANSANGPDIEEVLASAINSPAGGIQQFTARASVGSGTNFAAGITEATTVATDPANTMDRTIVAYLSDGVGGGDVPSALAGVPAEVDFFTFAVGSGASCGSSGSTTSLQFIADDTGGTCTEVPDVAALPDILPEVISSDLNALRLRVNGGAPQPIFADPGLPHPGPVAVTYTVDTDPLGPGVHELCVTAEGGDHGGVDSVTDCHEVIIGAEGEAFAISVPGLIAKTPHATCPPGKDLTLASVVTGLVNINALSAACGVDPDTGETVATAGVDQASLLAGAISISNIESTCVAGSGGLHGSSSVGTINGTPIGTAPGSLTIPLVATVHFNETSTGPNGELVQNAVRVQTLLGQQIILAGCRLG